MLGERSSDLMADTGGNILPLDARINELLELSTWQLRDVNTGDDQVILLAAAFMDRDRREEAIDELEILAEAVREFHRVNDEFPEVIKNLDETGALTAEETEKLKKIVADFKVQFVAKNKG